MPVAFFLLAVPAFADIDRRSHLSSDPQVNHAKVLFSDGRFDEAVDILRPLAPEHPDSIDVHFSVGLVAMGASGEADTEDERPSCWMSRSLHCGLF